MAFYFTCPYCFKKTLVDESLSGRSGPCASCGKTVVVPAAPASQPPAMQPVGAPNVVQPGTIRSPNKTLSWLLTTLAATIVIMVVGGAAIYLSLPTLSGLKARHDKAACMNNLRQIALALNQYAAQHGSYPPPIVYDDKGKPKHSWRVLILRELGQPSLYAQYNFDEPWDSPSNIQLLGNRCPRVYISPAIANSRNLAETNYFLVTGKNTVFPPSGSLRPSEVSDGLNKTLLVVESDNSIVEWTKPIDIDFSKLNSRIGATGPNTIGGVHQGGATSVFADGTPAWIPDDISPEMLDSLITPNGGEPVDPSQFELR
ncbi:MAG: DUF1559 domain-containing protein [Pirellulaceae bacterium]